MIYRIPYGFRFETTDLLAAHRQLCDLREGVSERMNAHTRQLFVKNIIPKIDEDTAQGKLKTPMRMYAAEFYDEFRDRQKAIRTTQRRDPEVDFDCAVTLYPLDGQIYGVVYTEHKEWARYILNRIPHDDFSSNVSEEDEEEDSRREAIWERAFGGTNRYSASTRGLKFEFSPLENYHPKMEEIALVAPSFETRLLTQARSKVREDKWKSIFDRLSETERQGVHLYAMEAHRFASSEEGLPLVNDEIERLRPILLKLEEHRDLF